MVTNGYVILPLWLILIWLFVILLYRHVYNRRINQILNGEKGKRMIAPWKVSLIALFAALIAYNVIFLVQMKNTPDDRTYNSSEFFGMSLSGASWENLEAISWPGNYNHEENSTYTKTEYTQDDFKYTVFDSQLFHDGMHPDMIVCIEYTGEEKDFYTMYTTCRFLDPKGNPINTSMKGENPASCFMYMLRYTADCTVEITLDYVMSEEDAKQVNVTDLKEKSEVLKEISALHEVFTIDVTQPY